MKQLKISVLALLVFTILCGLIYPAVVTGAGYLFFRGKAAGSLLVNDGRIRGSLLIGQNFNGQGYFHPRPSSAGYDASLSGGSNLSHTNRKLTDMVIKRADILKTENNLSPDSRIPADLLFASGSGLDPHISVDAALIQADRIAGARKVEKAYIYHIIDLNTERHLPFYGKMFVNVLKLNAALDGMEVTK
jgi:K+-transporting ATPase ATPase C chain